MAILTCERCGNQTAKLQPCTYCQKKDCVACIKSSRRKNKREKIYICRGCWGSLKVRAQFKETPNGRRERDFRDE